MSAEREKCEAVAGDVLWLKGESFVYLVNGRSIRADENYQIEINHEEVYTL